MTQLAKTNETNTALVFQDDGAFQRALRIAQVMSEAQTMPKHLKTPGDCLRVVELALRTNQSPYALADKTFVVGGKVAFEGQLCAALLNASPVIEERLSYDYSGEGDKRKCVVSARIRGEEKPRTIEVDWQTGHDQSPSNKPLWIKQPDQQLAYWGARVWGRRHAPEVLMGIYTRDEIEEQERERPATCRVIDEETGKTLTAGVPKEEEPEAATEIVADPNPEGPTHEMAALALEEEGIDSSDFLAYYNDLKGEARGWFNEIPMESVTKFINGLPKSRASFQRWLDKQ